MTILNLFEFLRGFDGRCDVHQAVQAAGVVCSVLVLALVIHLRDLIGEQIRLDQITGSTSEMDVTFVTSCIFLRINESQGEGLICAQGPSLMS